MILITPGLPPVLFGATAGAGGEGRTRRIPPPYGPVHKRKNSGYEKVAGFALTFVFNVMISLTFCLFQKCIFPMFHL